MILFPTIDLMDGQAVRLKQGDYLQKTVYSPDPLKTAALFKEAGAAYMHVVDLDGAREGRPVNFDTVTALIRESGLKVEIGGGIRSEKDITAYAEAGAWRIILGTVAAEDPALLEKALNLYGERIAVGVDLWNGQVRIRGWLHEGEIPFEEYIYQLQAKGVKHIICTDITRDGMLKGVNLLLYRRLKLRFPNLDLVASGGVSSPEDIRQLDELGIRGAIIGKALYTGNIDLNQVIAAAGDQTV